MRQKQAQRIVSQAQPSLVSQQLKDFNRDCFKFICHTDYKDQNHMIYLTDLCQPTLWKYLLKDKNYSPDSFVETSDEWANMINGVRRKCELVVNVL